MMTNSEDDSDRSESQRKLLEDLGKIFAAIPFNQMLGLKLTKLTQEGAVVTFDMRDELVGNFLQNILHGGVTSSVLDMVGGIAAIARVVFREFNQNNHDVDIVSESLGKSSTVDLQVSYLRPARGQQFVAQAWVVHAGSRLSFVRMEMRDQDNVLLASGSGTYNIFPLQK